jgi:glycyl-tRNA synthetase
MATGPNQPPSLDTIVAFCKRRGFVFPAAGIYDGINGIYDIGPLGTLLKENVRAFWTHSLRTLDQHIVFFEGAQLGPERMWAASGHTDSFHDPLIECTACHARFRADDIDVAKACSKCGTQAWSDIREFHMMFKTQLGAAADQSLTAYLRPETAQSIFVNFKNIMTTSRAKIPFGIAQIGKAFRNEITPKQFVFRMREFEQMELEWFCKASEADEFFTYWKEQRRLFYANIGINHDNIRFADHQPDELAHYAQKTTDIEYHFPFGWKELEGIAYRTDYDLKQHTAHSGKDLSVYDEETQSSYIPHVVECSLGVDRLLLTILCDAYREEETPEGPRTVLQIARHIAAVSAAVLPLCKKLAEPARDIYRKLKKHGLIAEFDITGSIGKRYRRQDEIGTPFCITYDYDTPYDHHVTIRYRDSMKQERISIDTVVDYVKALTSFSSTK